MKYPGKLLVLVAIFTTGCAHVDPTETGQSRRIEDYYPLAVGNCWSYTASFQGQQQPDLKVCIVKHEKDYFVDDRQNPSRLRFDAEGLRDGSVRYLLKAPLEAGQKWMSVVDVNKVEHYQIEAVDKQVKVPAGNFRDCVVVRMEEKMTSDRSIVIWTTFAPKTGIVEIKTAFHVGAKQVPQIHMRLKNYQPGTEKAK
jgi:hypothetical protein